MVSLDGGDSSEVASAIDGDTDATDVVQVYATTSPVAQKMVLLLLG